MEHSYIDALPAGLDVQAICPHQRNPWARDQTCFNASKTVFVTAFNIFEHTMMNDMGRVVWGSFERDPPKVLGQLREHSVYCWERPFASWLDDDCFAVKIPCDNQRHPIVVVHIEKGFQTVRNSGDLETHASQITKRDLSKNWLADEKGLCG